jgi:hypothetical protein
MKAICEAKKSIGEKKLKIESHAVLYLGKYVRQRQLMRGLQQRIARLSDPNPTDDFLAHAIRIGDIALVGLGVEAFFETGEESKQNHQCRRPSFLDIPTEQLCIYPEKKISQKADGNIQINMHFLIYCLRFTVNQRSGILIQNKKRLLQRYAR